MEKVALYGTMGMLFLFLQLDVLYAQVDNFQSEKGIPIYPIRSVAPSPAIKGMIYINSTDNTFYWYNGTLWVELVGNLLSGKPSVKDISITGNFYLGEIVSGTYTYVPDAANGSEEKNSVYTWYYATDSQGAGSQVVTGKTGTLTQATAGTATSYTIASPVVGTSYLALGITPKTLLGGDGAQVLSSWTRVYSGTINTTVSLTANSVLYKGQVLTPVVSFTYAGTGLNSGSCAESGATYQWYRNSSASATGATAIGTGNSYTVLDTDLGSYIGMVVTPNNACNAIITTGENWKQVTALNPTISAVNVTGTYTNVTTYALDKYPLTASYAGYACTPLPTGDTGTNSTYKWYWTNDGGATYIAVATGGTSASYTVNKADANFPATGTVKIACGITPVAASGDIGTERKSSLYTVASLNPTYSTASINPSTLTNGCTKNGTTVAALLGTYSTSPVNLVTTVGTPTYQWYRATDASGTGKTAISGQSTSSHLVNVTNGSYGYNNYSYLAVGITAHTTTGEVGTEVLSSWLPVWQCGETLTVVHTNGDGYSPLTATIAYETLPIGGTCWQGRNLGATEFNTAITNESRGWFYQWNTKQGYYTNGTTVTPTWVDNTNTDQLWATANDPCVQLGSTWHVPNYTEMAGMAGCFTGTRMGDIVNASRINLKMYFLPVGFLDNGSFSSMGMLQMDFWMNGSDVNSTTWQVYDGGQNQYWNLRSSTGSYSIRCCR